jgi:hypothetical protein
VAHPTGHFGRCTTGQPASLRGEPSRPLARISGVLSPVLLGLLAALSPTPGEWRSGTGVRFTVDRGSGLVQPAVRARRCGRHPAVVVRPGFVAVSGERFESRARIVRRRTVVRLHLSGRFTSRRAARGLVRTRVRLRGTHRVCSTGMRPWKAHPRRSDPVGEDPDDEPEDPEDPDDEP